MVWVLATVVVILLFLFYYYLIWSKKRELTKLRRKYDENGQHRESEQPPGDWIKNRRPASGSVEPEQPVTGNDEPRTEQLLPATDSIVVNEDSGKSGEDDDTENGVTEDDKK